MGEKEQGISLLGLGLWGAAVIAIFLSLAVYQSTPGDAADAPSQWPSDVEYHQGWTAVAVIHPRCSCTRASLAELQRLMVSIRDRVHVVAFFGVPSLSEETWMDTPLWKQASEIEGIELVPDVGGRIAQRFGVHTSGQLLLYDGSRELRFAGGITSGRGHQGESAGRVQLLAALEGAPAAQTSVYGCSIDGIDQENRVDP